MTNLLVTRFRLSFFDPPVNSDKPMAAICLSWLFLGPLFLWFPGELLEGEEGSAKRGEELPMSEDVCTCWRVTSVGIIVNLDWVLTFTERTLLRSLLSSVLVRIWQFFPLPEKVVQSAISRWYLGSLGSPWTARHLNLISNWKSSENHQKTHFHPWGVLTVFPWPQYSKGPIDTFLVFSTMCFRLFSFFSFSENWTMVLKQVGLDKVSE